jgi:hypothetical protein
MTKPDALTNNDALSYGQKRLDVILTGLQLAPENERDQRLSKVRRAIDDLVNQGHITDDYAQDQLGAVLDSLTTDIETEPPVQTDTNPATKQIIGLYAEDEYRKMKARELAKQRIAQEAAGAAEMPEMLLLDKFLAEPDEPIRYRIQGCWPAGGRIVTAAQYKAGKTTLRDNMAKSLVDGYDFLDKFQVHRPEGRIVVLDLEMDREQLKRWLRAHNINNKDRIVVVPMRGKGATLNLALPEARAKWAAKLQGFDTSIVILDCLRPIMDALGLDENRDAGKFLVWFDALLNEAGVAEANVIHHMGHGQERSRGDSRILDWPDATWTLVRKDPDNPASERYFKAFGRDVDIRESLLGYDEFKRKLTYVGGSRADVDADTALPHGIAYLRANDGANQTAIQKSLKDDHGFPFKVTKKAIAKGDFEGLIEVSTGGSGTASVHRLTGLAKEKYPTDSPIQTDSQGFRIGPKPTDSPIYPF